LGLRNSLSVDEGMSWYVALSPGHAGQLDVHPPLYFYLLHFWLMTGHDEAWLRLSSVLAGTFCVPALFWALGQAGWERSRRWLPCWLVACSTYAVQYSRELRMYPLLSLEVLLGFGCLLGLRRAGEERRRLWFGYFLCSLAAAWTHYFGLFLLLLAPLVLRRRQLPGWLLCSFAVAISLLPWVDSVAGRVRHHDFSLRFPPAVSALPETAGRILFGDLGPTDNLWFQLLGLTVLAWLVVRARSAPLWIWVWAVLPLALVWFESRWGPAPVFEFKYFGWTLPAWCCLFGLSRPHRALLGLWLVANLAGQCWLLQSHNRGQDWRSVANFLHNRRELTLVQPSMMAAPLLYYGVPPDAMHPVDTVADVKPLLNGQRECLLVTTPFHPEVERENLPGWLARVGRVDTLLETRRSLPSAVVRVQSWTAK
jgi:hypothetical protein